MHPQLNLVLIVALLAIVGAAAADKALPGCIDKCGNVSIPYPFGVGISSESGKSCFLEERFNVTCQNNTLYHGNAQVLNITLEGQLDMMFYVSQLCNDDKDGVANRPSLRTPAFTISNKENKFISVGCDTYGYLNSHRNGEEYSTGCLTRCSKLLPHMLTEGECSGIGCCQVDIPSGMKNITIQAYEFNYSLSFSKCSYSFVAKRGSYNFSIAHLNHKLPFTQLPMVVDWDVGNETCEFFQKGAKSACMNNSYCDDSDTSSGYRCGCKTGYDGNPYHPNGCQGAAAADKALPGCIDKCGNVSIPYPFGVGISSESGKSCFLEERFNVTCQNNTLFHGNVQVLNITLEGQLDMMFYVSRLCNDDKDGVANSPSLRTPAFTISNKENKFISVGCDTYGYLNSHRNGEEYSTGCLTRCSKLLPHMVTEGECSGIGCCQVDIPSGMKNITIQAYEFNYSLSFSKCSYSFVAKRGSYNFSIAHLNHKLPFTQLPMVVDWDVGNETCEFFQKGAKSACMNNSYCDDSDTSSGYRCGCKTGYDGNPYHPNGCQDIDECKTKNHTCISDLHCRNTDGFYECFCPHGQVGNGKDRGGGCQPIRRESITTKFAIGACAVFIALLGASWLYLVYQKWKLVKQREKFFRQNGGFILQQRLSGREDSPQTAQIFTAEELEKATNNYNVDFIIGKGGFGTVFKGVLADNSVVAVKKSKVIDQTQTEQFINEVIILSQINHRNVVNLLGCCLDTEVPLLVYEFVNNGTLFDHLHNESKAGNLSWGARLGIAIEAAGALSYLHSDPSTTIIHRDVKSANILLDDNYTAKVSDFGASTLVPLDQAILGTMVQGTFGYLDPEYMQTSQLTRKSDVYSFGVVLLELLTGKEALSYQRSEEERCLALHFLCCLENDRLFEILESGLLNEENKEEIMEVANLASKCLRLKGNARPSMKEVEMELRGIRKIDEHPWTNIDLNLEEESQYLLQEVSGTYNHGGSSMHGNTGFDSLRDHVLIAFDVAR